MAKSRKKNAETPPNAPEMTGDANVRNLDRERVAARAYEIYQARGGTDGLAMEDWLAAEREFAQAPGKPDEQS